MTPSKYVAFEGLEGCGKSTHVARLAERLGAVATREPGGTPVGTALRAAMLDPANTSLSPRAEALLMAADRAQHIAEVVSPALNAGRHVVSDRSVYSSLAYQGHGRQLGEDAVRRINDWALNGTWPDLVVLIDVPLDVLAERMKKRELDRFEREDRAFFERVYAGFLSMAAAEPERFVVVDGTPPKDDLQATIAEMVAARLGIA
jgi:dTMP kinase